MPNQSLATNQHSPLSERLVGLTNQPKRLIGRGHPPLSKHPFPPGRVEGHELQVHEGMRQSRKPPLCLLSGCAHTAAFLSLLRAALQAASPLMQLLGSSMLSCGVPAAAGGACSAAARPLQPLLSRLTSSLVSSLFSDAAVWQQLVGRGALCRSLRGGALCCSYSAAALSSAAARSAAVSSGTLKLDHCTCHPSLMRPLAAACSAEARITAAFPEQPREQPCKQPPL